MGYDHLFEPCDLALLHDWLQETGELYMDLDRPHSGGLNNSVYFIHRLSEIRAIVSQPTFPDIQISIFRAKQYPIRGIANETLLTIALEQIPDGQWFSMIETGADSLTPCMVIGYGDSHDELRDEFSRHQGKTIRFGQNPFDQWDANYFEQPDSVWVARDYLHPKPHISKNRTSYAPFDTRPEIYQSCLQGWYAT